MCVFASIADAEHGCSAMQISSVKSDLILQQWRAVTRVFMTVILSEYTTFWSPAYSPCMCLLNLSFFSCNHSRSGLFMIFSLSHLKCLLLSIHVALMNNNSYILSCVILNNNNRTYECVLGGWWLSTGWNMHTTVIFSCTLCSHLCGDTVTDMIYLLQP